MARTKAMARKQNYGLVRVRPSPYSFGRHSSFKLRCARAKARDYKCQRCDGDMKAYTKIRETNRRFNGVVCPPCTRDMHLKDGEMRNSLGSKGYALIVPQYPHDRMELVRYQEPEYWERVGRIFDGFPRTLSHTKDARIDAVIRYECDVADDPGSILNNRAERIAMNMGIFDLHADRPLKGNVIFSGPAFLPLTRAEVEQFIAWAK